MATIFCQDPRTASLLILFAAYFSPITYAGTKDPHDAQLVRLRYVQGDVRFNRGDGKHPDLKQPWEVAITNLPIEQNYALATGDGRAEVEFEDGSVVYLAENTVMLFNELTSTDDVPATTLELVSGTVTAGLQPLPDESFEIDTPTGQIASSYPQRSFVRIDAYLDGMELTPQVDTTTDLNSDAESAPLAKGQTITFPDGAAPRAAKPGEFRTSDDFDNWARARYQARTVTMDAALKASRLSSPMTGPTDMYESGTFTPCAPNGMCWEPKSAADTEAATLQPQASALETAPGQTAWQGKLEVATALQSSGQGSGQTLRASGSQNAKPFQPVTVSTFSFRSPDSCPFGAWTNSRAATAIGQEHVDEARTPDELRELQMRNSNTQTLLSFPVCHYARWVHHGARYRTVIRRKRVHHPVHWVKVGKQTGRKPA